MAFVRKFNKGMWSRCSQDGLLVTRHCKVNGLDSKSANSTRFFKSYADSSLIVKVGVPFANNSFGVDSEQRTEKCELVNQRQDVDKKRKGFTTVAEFTVY